MIQCAYCGKPFYPNFMTTHQCRCGAVYVLRLATSNSTAPIRYLAGQTAVSPSNNARTEVPQAFYDAFEDKV